MSDSTQIVRYLFVGGLVTLADAALYNFLTGRDRQMARIPANILSTTFGMLLGFSLHFVLVFQPNVPRMPARIASYLVTVGCSVYIVQNIAIHLCSGRLRHAFAFFSGRVGATASAQRAELVDRLAGKCVAAAAGMVWNFLFFKHLVYA